MNWVLIILRIMGLLSRFLTWQRARSMANLMVLNELQRQRRRLEQIEAEVRAIIQETENMTQEEIDEALKDYFRD